ncbi:hypothetical protein [Herbaspirillum sp. NPDC087042]|uniref:hypothetical protein n=1 Tax=Herbaspirillum sp. NPDC087042 TaxID=3364004 RepID=UPI0018EBCABA|nr:hypothetical protein [Herbaspirillum sp. ASV7]
MSNFSKTLGSTRVAQPGFTLQNEKPPRSHEGGFTSHEHEQKKQEQADQQSDAGPRRYDGGDIYRKGHRGESEKRDQSL